MYRPFVCKVILPQPQFAHIYLLHLFLCRSISSTQQKQTKRVGRGGGVCHPLAKNSRQPPYPCSCLILLASTTDKLIFESCVLVVCFALAVALCSPPAYSVLIIPQVSQRVIFALADIPLPIAAKQRHSAYIWLTYRLSNYAGTY